VFLTIRLHVQAVSVGVEPLNAGERVSGDIAINQCAAPLTGNYLAHFCEHNWDKSAVCDVVTFCIVSKGVHRHDRGAVGGDKRHQGQKNVSAGPVHFLKLLVHHPRAKRLSFLLGLHPADWLSLDSGRQCSIQLCGGKHLTGTTKRLVGIKTGPEPDKTTLTLRGWDELIKSP